MKIEIKPYTVHTLLTKEFHVVPWWVQAGASFWYFFALVSFSVHAKDLDTAGIIVESMLLGVLFLTGYRVWNLSRNLKSIKGGVTLQEVEEWVTISQLAEACPDKTLTVYTFIPGQPVVTFTGVLRLIFASITQPFLPLSICITNGVCNSRNLSIISRAESAELANAVFGHEMGHLVPALRQVDTGSITLYKALPSSTRDLFMQTEEEDIETANELFEEWDADLYAIYHGRKHFKIPAEQFVKHLIGMRVHKDYYHPAYHLSILYADILTELATNFEEHYQHLSWVEFVTLAYQRIPPRALSRWRKIISRAQGHLGVEYAFEKGYYLFEKAQKTKSLQKV